MAWTFVIVYRLTFDCSLAELTSLERLLEGLMQKDAISPAIIKHLWHMFGNTTKDISAEQRRGAIAILGMLASHDREMINERAELVAKIGLEFEVCFTKNT